MKCFYTVCCRRGMERAAIRRLAVFGSTERRKPRVQQQQLEGPWYRSVTSPSKARAQQWDRLAVISGDQYRRSYTLLRCHNGVMLNAKLQLTVL
jgi:hypothetical protein